MTPEEILRDQKKAKQAQRDLDRLTGAREREMEQLAEQFKISSTEAGRELLGRLQDELTVAEDTYQKAKEALWKLLAEKMGET